jgi:predicted outer membrane protein
MKIRALALITALALPTLAVADKTPTDTKTPATGTTTDTKDTKNAKLADADVKIIAQLHHVNQMEIDMGKAAQKSGTASVKSYGETLVKDHQSNDKDLTAFAKTHKVNTIPAYKPETDAEKQEHKDMMAKMAQLKTLKGADFDKEFLTTMAADHDKVLARIDVAIGAATDTDLQNMLKAVKPVLQRHADQARDLQKNTQASNEPAKLPSTR